MKLFASIHGMGTKNLHHVAAFMAEGMILRDKGSIHNNKRCISKDQRDKVDAHLCVSQYAGHGKKQRYLSSELYTLFWQFNYPEHCMHLQSGLYPKEAKSDTQFRFCYDYFRAKFNYGFCMPTSDVCCRCILFNVENNVKKHSYFKLLAVKAVIVEDLKML